jgi:hypothetical protein
LYNIKTKEKSTRVGLEVFVGEQWSKAEIGWLPLGKAMGIHYESENENELGDGMVKILDELNRLNDRLYTKINEKSDGEIGADAGAK